MGFTAADVKNLREMTGVGMMDCKKALAESDGNIDKAIEWLREKGLAAAQKKAGRIAAEGMAYAWVCPDCGVGSIVEVNAESDFVAKNDLFVDYVHNVAKVVAKDAPADLDALFACKYPGTDKTVLEEQNDKVLVIGENIKVRRFARYDKGTSIAYVHMGGRIAVLMNLEVGAGFEKNPAVEELGKDLAMQVAALNPQFLDKSESARSSSRTRSASVWPRPRRTRRTPLSPTPSSRRSSWAALPNTTRRSASCSSRSSRTTRSPSRITSPPSRSSSAPPSR